MPRISPDGSLAARSHTRVFCNQVKNTIKANKLPEYHATYDSEKDQVILYTRDLKKLLAGGLPTNKWPRSPPSLRGITDGCGKSSCRITP